MKTILLKNAICICLMTTVFSFKKLNAQEVLPQYGITLCGAEFGETKLPGILNVDYTYPNEIDIDYFVAKGVDLIQLPFKWERVQRTLGGDLDQNELASIKKFIDACADRNIKVTLVLQNFGKYKKDCVEYKVGESEVSAWNLRDFWMKLSTALIDKPNIFAYSIMAEPADMQSCVWVNTVQYVIDGIRTVDTNTTILIEGNNYSNSFTWKEYNDELKNLKDPANKLVFNAHCYFDKDYSGKYAKSFVDEGADEMIGVMRVIPFINWLKENNLNGFVGEFGVPKNDAGWMTVLNNFLDYINNNNIGGCYWAAGKWWKDYPLSIQPIKLNDQPQLQIFSKYFMKNKYLSDLKSTQIWTRLFKIKKVNRFTTLSVA